MQDKIKPMTEHAKQGEEVYYTAEEWIEYAKSKPNKYKQRSEKAWYSFGKKKALQAPAEYIHLEQTPATPSAARSPTESEEADVKMLDDFEKFGTRTPIAAVPYYFNFGKHAGKEMRRVLAEDPSYLTWVIAKVCALPDARFPAFCRPCLRRCRCARSALTPLLYLMCCAQKMYEKNPGMQTSLEQVGLMKDGKAVKMRSPSNGRQGPPPSSRPSALSLLLEMQAGVPMAQQAIMLEQAIGLLRGREARAA